MLPLLGSLSGCNPIHATGAAPFHANCEPRHGSDMLASMKLSPWHRRAAWRIRHTWSRLRHAVAGLPLAAPVPAGTQSRPTHISRALLENLKAHIAQDTRKWRNYGAPSLPPGVLPEADKLGMSGSAPIELAMDGGLKEPRRMALDNGGTCAPVYNWLNGANQYGAGLWFPGYPYLAELTQISEYRAPSETTSTEMTRKWVELVSKGKGDKSDKIEKLNARMIELDLRDKFRRAALQDGFFGRSQIYLNIGDADDAKRQLPLMITPEGIAKGSLKSVTVIEPYWSTPYSWNSSYPERADFYVPQSWYIMGRKTHSTRLLTFIGREVPDLLKPAYNFGGMSLTQLMEPYVNMWLRTRKSVNDLVNAFSIPILATDMSATLEDGGAPGSGLIPRAQVFTATRNNLALAIINKDSEEITTENVPLSGLSDLQAQSQEHMSMPAHIPLIKMFGVTPTGLNATGEGEIQVWYDHVGAYQENLFGPNFGTILKVLQLDLFGQIDDDISYQWVKLDEPTQKELSEIRKTDAEAGVAYITNSVISPEEERERLQSDPDSGYDNLDGPAPEPQPDPDMEMQLGHEADQADASREHENDSADNAHERAKEMLAEKAKNEPAVPIRAKTGK